MILKFTKLIIHNFLSYGHAEIELNDKNYCLVIGKNNSKSDNAKSNGAGKSSWGSAICWALTGETIQGLSSNIKNINIEENLCYVTVDFMVNSDSYRISRYKNPKSDLKVELNGQDISGKGIRESEEILSRYLPDLTSQLIASIIILGQGLPNKFTANTPSGRKDVLEKLSKSDFMIQDLKTRVASRSDALTTSLKAVDDNILAKNAKLGMTQELLTQNKKLLAELTNVVAIDSSIAQLTNNLTELDKRLADIKIKADKDQAEYQKIVANYEIIVDNKNSELTIENSDFQHFRDQFICKKFELLSKIENITAEIKKIDSITDICPTCGQKLPNVEKISSEHLKLEVDMLQKSLSEIEQKYAAAESEHNGVMIAIESKYKLTLQECFSKKQLAETELNKNNLNLQNLSNDKIAISNQLATEIANKNALNDKIEACKLDINKHTSTISALTIEVAEHNSARENLLERIQVINQFSTLLKRDFRGYLLAEIISYIDKKCKEYCKTVFGSDIIDFKLEGNNINITYAGKSFENLSGGEKQKIDLIIQFAIRSMMQQYLNFSSNILILDEIFDQLDLIGCENILQLITNQVNDVESIFIISHRADELEIPYDCQMIITKDENNISSIVVK